MIDDANGITSQTLTKRNLATKKSEYLELPAWTGSNFYEERLYQIRE